MRHEIQQFVRVDRDDVHDINAFTAALDHVRVGRDRIVSLFGIEGGKAAQAAPLFHDDRRRGGFLISSGVEAQEAAFALRVVRNIVDAAQFHARGNREISAHGIFAAGEKHNGAAVLRRRIEGLLYRRRVVGDGILLRAPGLIGDHEQLGPGRLQRLVFGPGKFRHR